MARDYKIRVRVDNAQAKRELQELDKGLGGLGVSARQVGVAAGAAAVAIAGMVARQAIQNAIQQEQAVRQLEAAITSTGGAAGRSSEQLQEMASALQAASIFGDDELMKAQSQLLTFTSIAGEAFDRTMQSVVDLSVRMDQDLRSSVVMLGKALNDPVANLGALSRAGIQFSDAQKEVIKDLAESGRLAEAQGVILEELERQFGGAGAAARDTLGGAITQLSNVWGDFTELLVQDEAGEALRAFVETAITLLSKLIEYWGILRATALEAMADIYDVGSNRFGAAAISALVRQTTGISLNIDPKAFEDTAKALRERANQALDEWAGLTEKADASTAKLTTTTNGFSGAVQSLAAKLAQNTRQEEFLIAAFQRGDAEFRRAERVVAAYNAVIVDGVAQLGLFDEALQLEGLRTQRENLEKLDRNFKALAASIAEAERAWKALVEEESVWWNRGGERAPLPEGERLDPWAIPVNIEIPPPSDAELEEFRLNYGEALSESLRGELSTGAAAAVGEAFSTILAGGKVEFERFFQSLGDIGIHFFVDRFATALSKALDGVAGTWKELVATFKTGAGQTAGWLSAAGIVAGAQNTDYAAIGAALGTVVGGILGAGVWSWATAALGASVGAWLGSLVKKGSPEFFGAIESELGKIQIGKSDLGGGAKAVAKAFEDDLQEAMKRILEQIGGTLEGIDPGISLKLKDDKLSVFIDGLEHRFKEDIEGGISFALTEALKRADISGASQTFIQILENTTAKSLDQLTDALDWGRWYERLRLGDVAADLQERMFKFGQDIRRAIEFGLPTDIITLDLGVDFDSYRNQILGIVETDEERIRRQAEAFNQWRQITEAEQLARAAELTAQKATLEAEVAIIRARLAVDQNNLNIRQEMLGVDIAINTAEWELLNSKLAALAAIDAALLAAQGILASLPDLISDQEINDAINRSRGGGGRQRAEAREDLRAEVLLYGLTDVQLQLAEAGLFADDFAERLRGMGYSAEEAARLLALAQEEEDRRVEQVRADVRQSYYDAIAAAQGLSEIWGIKDQFRDLRQQILDAGFSAEETAERLAGLNWAEGIELQRVEMGIAGRLFGYLEGSEEYAARSLEFKQAEVELEFAVMQAQLQLLGVWDQYVQIWTDAKDAALAVLDVPDLEPPARQVRNHFEDAARDASRIAESFMQAKQSVAEFLNEMLVGTYGGVSPVGGVEEATRQFDEVLRQALTGNIGAIENFDDYGQTLLRLARDAYGSSPEFQAIYDYVLAAGRDVLGVRTGREGNLVFDERFYQGQQNQTAEQQRTNDLLAAIERRLANQQGSRPIAGQGVN